MKTTRTNINYVEWLSAEVMHNASRDWLSELNFIKDEQMFFDDLIKSYTLQLIDSKHFGESNKIVNQLSTLQKKTKLIIKAVRNHENKLQIMVDGIDQLEEEENYKEEHRRLIGRVSKFREEYRTHKKELFALIKKIMKEGKQKRLLK